MWNNKDRQQRYRESGFSTNSDKRNYPEGVEVTLDDKTSFKAEVFKNRDKVKHIRLYGISTGKHKVSVLFKMEKSLSFIFTQN